jgi:hypothetical protein
MSRPKKAKHLRSTSAGISLEPALTKQAKALAKAEGHISLSSYVRILLTRAIDRAANSSQQFGEKQTRLAKSKLKKADN